MDYSALKLGQKNINTVGRDDLPCFGAEAVASFINKAPERSQTQ
jgi:hypothetical protein